MVSRNSHRVLFLAIEICAHGGREAAAVEFFSGIHPAASQPNVLNLRKVKLLCQLPKKFLSRSNCTARYLLFIPVVIAAISLVTKPITAASYFGITMEDQFHPKAKFAECATKITYLRHLFWTKQIL